MSLGSVAAMRRLLLLVAVLVGVDTMLYAALTPLLPHFVHEFGFSKSRAGVLVAAYAAGALVGGLPGGVASARLGASGSPTLANTSRASRLRSASATATSR